MPDQEIKEQPQVTVRGIPQNQYNSNVAASTQDDDQGQQQGGIEGHFKKHWVIYSLVIGAATLLVIVYLNNRNSSGTNTTGSYTGYDTTGTTAASDTYGASLDSDYQQLIQQGNTTNSLLQQLLNGYTTGTTGGTKGTGGGTKGTGGGTKGTGGGKKKPPKKTKPGGSTGGTSSGHSGSSSGGHNKTGKTSSTHATGTTHNSGKTTIHHGSSGYGKQKNYNITTNKGIPAYHITGPGAKPRNARWVTATKGSTLSDLQRKYFPGSSGSPKQGNIVAYGKNFHTLSKGTNFTGGKLNRNVRIQV